MVALIRVGLIPALVRFVMAVSLTPAVTFNCVENAGAVRDCVEACRVKIPWDLLKRVGGNPDPGLLFWRPYNIYPNVVGAVKPHTSILTSIHCPISSSLTPCSYTAHPRNARARDAALLAIYIGCYIVAALL